jgi:hypothetical protein
MDDELLVIAHSAYGAERAETLLRGRIGARILHAGPGMRGIRRAVAAIARSQAGTVYLVDLGASTTVAAAFARLRGRRVVLDTGDAAYELAKSTGSHRGARLMAVRLGERLATALASHVVVRGRAHLELLPGKPATFVPDVAPPAAAPLDGTALRRELDLEGRFVAGLVGSLVWAPRLERCYGWDLIEALPGASVDVVALIVGDGSGRDWLERRARELGVIDRCRFVGQQSSDRVAEYIAAMDVGTSTQTNDTVGQVRTTGKLPLYLACGRPVVASHVGEAARLLGPLGWTVRYDGTTDPEFPARLAAKLNEWPRDPGTARAREEAAIELAAREFDPARWGSLLAAVLSSGRD